MKPIIDNFWTVDDKTVGSCEPSSLKAFLYASDIIGSWSKNERPTIGMIQVKSEPVIQSEDNKNMYTAIYHVGIGFYIKKVWHSAKIGIRYYYSSCTCSTSTDSREISRQENDELIVIDSFVDKSADKRLR